MKRALSDNGGHRARKLLVFGCGGQVGQALLQAELPQGFSIVGLTRPEADLTDASRLATLIEVIRPDLVINAGAYTAVDRAESEPDAAFACNRDGPANLASLCARNELPLIHLSTDYVFDGSRTGAWREDDPTAPMGVYGASKLAGEQAVRERTDRYVIIRTAWVYSATGQNFVKTMLRLGDQRDELRIVADQTGCPTAAREIARAVLVVAEGLPADPAAGRYGTYHYCGRGETTWYGFAEAIFALARPYRRTTPHLVPISTADYPTPARRPANSVLDCSRIEKDYAVERPLWLDSLSTVINELHRS
jgi:dTDP-4-dehydrorhamnose reductase